MGNKFRFWLARQPLTRKLTSIVLMISGITLVVACVVLIAFDYSASRLRLVREVTTLADVVGSNSTGALAFGDARAAADTLKSLSVDGHVYSARLFTRDGAELAAYTPGTKPAQTFTFDAARLRNAEPSAEFDGMRMHVLRPVRLGTETVGAIVVESDTRDIWSRLAAISSCCCSRRTSSGRSMRAPSSCVRPTRNWSRPATRPWTRAARKASSSPT